MLSAYPECVIEAPGIAYEAERLTRSLEQAEAVEVLRTGDRARAAVVIGRPRAGMLGLETIPGEVYCGPDDLDAQYWAADTLLAQGVRLDHRFVALLSSTLPGVLDKIEGRGFKVQALELHGDQSVAFERLGGAEALRDRECRMRDGHGIHIGPLHSTEQVESLVEQRKLFFGSHQEVSPISASRALDAGQQAEIDAFVRKTLLEGMPDRAGTQFVVTRSDDEAVGGFGLLLRDNSPVWGKCAGVEVFLNSSAQGKGLGALMYLVVLRRMLELNVRTFRGTTANPAVVHLSRKMGRSLRGWKIVKGQYDARPAHLEYPVR